MVLLLQHEWEMHSGAINEGPSALKKDGKLFLSFSASLTETHYYSVGLLTFKVRGQLFCSAVFISCPFCLFYSLVYSLAACHRHTLAALGLTAAVTLLPLPWTAAACCRQLLPLIAETF